MHPEDDKQALLLGISTALVAEGIVFAFLFGLALVVLR